jgi:hypothetical protein
MNAARAWDRLVRVGVEQRRDGCGPHSLVPSPWWLGSSAPLPPLTVTTTSPTTTTGVSSVNPSTAGQSVTFTATVTTGATAVTIGTVQFSEGATPRGAPVTVAGDGTATYSGTPTLDGSTDTVAQVVEKRRGPPPGRPRP